MIPVLDWSEAARDPVAMAERLGAACRGPGFALITGHPVPADLIARSFAMADAFFGLPEVEKAGLSILRNPHNRGWAAMGSEKLDETADAPDRKEAFNIGLDLDPSDPRVLAAEPFRGVNVWPALPVFRETMLACFDANWSFGRQVMSVLARDLGLAPGWFDDAFDAPMATLRLLHYPAGSGVEGEIGAGAHTDYGAITLLVTDGEPGLQVRPRGGDWTDVPHVPGAVVMNIGDCLMRWSNDIYMSTPHRVLPPRRVRRSIAFFLDPNPEAVISALPGTGAPRYGMVTGAAYLRGRLDATYDAERTP